MEELLQSLVLCFLVADAVVSFLVLNLDITKPHTHPPCPSDRFPHPRNVSTADLPPEFPAARERLFRLGAQFASLPEPEREECARPETSYFFGWSHGKEVMNGVSWGLIAAGSSPRRYPNQSARRSLTP